MDNTLPFAVNKTNTTVLSLGHYLILVIFIFFAFFYGISSYLITDLNEGLYAEIAREMLVTHDYIIPHLNFVPYLEKPPLFYWLIALSDKIFGVSTFATRLIPALSAGFICSFLMFFGNSINRSKASWFAAIILSSSLGFILLAHVVIFDMLFTATLTAAILSFFLWYHTDHTRYLITAYVAVAISVMTKGLLGVIIPGGTAIIFMWLMQTPSIKLKHFFNPIGIIACIILTLPWHIAAAVQLHGFTWNYFINNQWYRYINQRIPHDYHTGPIYYYIPRIIVYLFPWSLFLPTLINKIQGKISQQDPLKVLLWTWFTFSLVIFSLSGAKTDYYMMVTTPALVLLLGLKFAEGINKTFLYLVWFITSLLLCSAAIFAYFSHNTPTNVLPLLLLVTVCLLFYFLIGLFILRLNTKPLYFFLFIASLMFPLLTFYVSVKQTVQTGYTQLALAQYILTHDNLRPVYLYQDYEDISSILFFLQRRLTIVDSKSDDLYLGAYTADAKNWFIDDQTFQNIAINRNVYVIVKNKKAPIFLLYFHPVHFCVIAKTETTSLLSNKLSECPIVTWALP